MLFMLLLILQFHYSNIGAKIKTLRAIPKRIILSENNAHLLLVDDDERILSLLGVPKGLEPDAKLALSKAEASGIFLVTFALTKSLCGVTRLTLFKKSLMVITKPVDEFCTIPPKFEKVIVGLDIVPVLFFYHLKVSHF